MKIIKLTQGRITKVDDSDFKYLNQWKWCAIRVNGNDYRAARSQIINGKVKTLLMHREIMNPRGRMVVDHGDHDGLNNQRYNLKNCTQSQNMMNQRPHGISKYLGVSYRTEYLLNGIKRSIIAQISINGRNTYLGTFKSEEEAAVIYNDAAKKYHGEYAYINKL